MERLREIRAQIDELLHDDYPAVRDDDLVVEYNIRLVSANGVEDENVGAMRLNRILHRRMIAEAPSRLEQGFMQQVFSPVATAFYDIIDRENDTPNDVTELQRTTENTLQLPAFT